jgi:rubrerythrin
MDIAKVLARAFKVEQAGREFYSQVGEWVIDPLAQSTFASLAHDEEAHAKLLARYHKLWGDKLGWPEELVEPEELDPETQEILKQSIGTLGLDASFQQVYEKARALEVANRDYYKAQAEKADDPTLGMVFKFLASVEQTHVEALDLLVETAKMSQVPGLEKIIK